MNIIAVLNRDGGTFKTTDMPDFETKVVEVFSAAGHNIDCCIVSGDKVVEALRDAASRRDIDCIVAGGGDGTISAAAGYAWESGKALGIVPAGTMNLFARSLNLPLDIWEVLETLASGEVKAVDIASANGKSFIHQFSAGMRSRMVRLREAREYGSRLSKIWATIRAAFIVMARPPRFEITFRIDGREDTRRISALSISNNEFGEDPLMYAERLDGGHLGVYMAASLTLRSATHLAFDILRGRLKDNSSVTALATSEIRLHFPRHRHGIRCVMDGELVAMDQDILVKIHPGELRVLSGPKDSGG